jgi:hypothetical protein
LLRIIPRDQFCAAGDSIEAVRFFQQQLSKPAQLSRNARSLVVVVITRIEVTIKRLVRHAR